MTAKQVKLNESSNYGLAGSKTARGLPEINLMNSKYKSQHAKVEAIEKKQKGDKQRYMDNLIKMHDKQIEKGMKSARR